MRVDPIYKNRVFKVEPDLCFVLMPFKNELEAVYSDHIRKVTQILGLRCVRADDIFSNSAIIEDIWDFINRARIVIADLTGKNPNVFYEVGVAHVVGKPVILVTQSIGDIPFDLRHLRNIVYEYTPRGMQKFEESLESTIRYVLVQPNTSVEQFRQELVADTFPQSAQMLNYTDDFVASFVLDRVNEIPFREKALELCFSRRIVNDSFLEVLYREKNSSLRKTLGTLVERYSWPIPESLLVALLQDERSVALAAVGAAHSLAKSGKYSSSILRYVASHASWEVQRNAVKRIIELDDKDSLITLLDFLTLDYHITADFIRKYIERQYSENRLEQSVRPSVVAFLKRYIEEEGFAETTREKLSRTLTTIQDAGLMTAT